MKLLKFTRYAEWWEYKLVPLLTVGYGAIAIYNLPLKIASLRLMMVILAIIFGAVYVSVINDITDIDEDRIANKKNAMMEISKSARSIILSLCILVGLVFSYKLFYPDILSLICYVLAYLVFTLYSTPPFRLKSRGILGVLCDAMGAHFFPTLVVSLSIIFYLKIAPNEMWTISIAAWAFFYGLRGILWHQFQDRENDIESNTHTFASKINPKKFKNFESIIFTIELIFLSGVMALLNNKLIIISIVAYMMLIIARRIILKYEISLIITPRNAPYQLLMNEFYIVFLPLALLIEISLKNQYGWVILCSHVLLFPMQILKVCKDLRYLIMRI